VKKPNWDRGERVDGLTLLDQRAAEAALDRLYPLWDTDNPSRCKNQIRRMHQAICAAIRVYAQHATPVEEEEFEDNGFGL
jgi:hypothetical protein